jgi:hypothetical protein
VSYATSCKKTIKAYGSGQVALEGQKFMMAMKRSNVFSDILLDILWAWPI